MPRIPQHFIDELLARTDIVELVDARVQLKKKGHEFAACCPFHTEKTPSFYVSPAKQFYHCFGCGAHGTAISFLMEFEHLEFPEAVRQLADQVGIEVPQEAGNPAGGQRESGTAPLYELLQQAGGFYKSQLKATPRAVDYLKQRSVSGEIAAEFGLGFAPAEWDALTNKLGNEKDRRDQLVTTGMAIRKDNGSMYDRFRDRIMFPIRDARGRTIGFGGRVLGNDEPKYLNSPETPLFHKGRELYGLYEARQVLRHITRLVVVEGYMDVLALAQHDIRYAVATLGTATTSEHLTRLFRICPEIVFCFDGDRAGRQAAWRALENALPAIHDGRQIRFLFLPEGEDPDSTVRAQGQQAFEEQLAQALPLSDYLLNELAANTDMQSVDGRARLVDQARPLLKRLPDPVYRAMLEQKLARLAQLPADRLSQLLAGDAQSPQARQGGGTSRRPGLRLALTPARRAIMLLLNRPTLAEKADQMDKLDELAALNIIPGLSPLLELIRYFQAQQQAQSVVSAAQALEHWRNEDLGNHLARLAQQQLESPPEGWEAEFTGLLAGFARRGAEQRLDTLRAKDFRDLSPAEKTELQNLLKS